MNIIRVLKLYKQHYLENYEKMAVEEYSCLGYFDCMSVELVKNRQSKGLLRTKGNINITDLWYTMANNTKKLNGYYGQQNIGMFRYETENSEVKDEEFWKDEQRAIIVIACMIQLTDFVNVAKSMKEIEELSCGQTNVRGITYRTFDNADLILFLTGNSYTTLSYLIDTIRNRKDVVYTYSVCGIAQKYLELLEKTDKGTDIQSVEYNGNRLVNDKIDEICLEIATDGKEELDDFFDSFGMKVESASVLGYTDSIVRVKDAYMQSVARLLRDGNKGITHKNSKFGNGIYNISTVILPEIKEKEKGSIRCSTHRSAEKGSWCMGKIEKLRNLEPKLNSSENEVLYSNWLALIRVLNVLSQYENAAFPRDIFRIIFPSVKLICQKFEKIIELSTEEFELTGLNETVQIEEYINGVDSLIQHLIHTSQVFLTVPGYSGSLYDIPTKLLLFYMAYARKVIKIYNDSGQSIECFICPLLNSKPSVEEITVETDKEMVLKIQLAQRHLYMPRAFLVILLHELFHSVGDFYRCRKERATILLKMCVYAIIYILIPPEKKEASNKRRNTDKCQTLKEKILYQIQESFINSVSDIFNRSDTVGEDENKKYLSKNLSQKLIKSIGDALYGIDDAIRELPDLSNLDVDDLREFLSLWSEELRQMKLNKKKLLEQYDISEIVHRFLYSFQEIYADLSSIICLDLDLEYYFEAIPISEGMVLSDDRISTVVVNRLSVVVYALQNYPCANRKKSWKKQWKELVKQESVPQRRLIDKVAAYISQMTQKNPQKKGGIAQEELKEGDIEWEFFYLDGVWLQQVEYARECIDKLRERSLNLKQGSDLEKIRAAFDLFQMYDLNQDKPYSELFDIYDELTLEYNREIDTMIK